MAETEADPSTSIDQPIPDEDVEEDLSTDLITDKEATLKLTPDPACGTSRGIKLSVNSRRNKAGDWVDAFTVRYESSISSDRSNLDVTHKVTECQGKRMIYIQGLRTTAELSHEIKDKLTFHQRCGKNAAILGNGRSVQKINLDDSLNTAVFSNRPLKDNELFEVKLDKRISKLGTCLGIGVVARNPNDVEILNEMFRSPYIWMYHRTNLYRNTVIIHANYGKKLDDLKAGDRVGVMRNEYGTLRFFVNGVDQGPAASGIPQQVYGAFELWGDATMATIVDAS